MRKTLQNAAARDTSVAIRFNYNKLQAAACITCSAAVSIGFIYWLARMIG